MISGSKLERRDNNTGELIGFRAELSAPRKLAPAARRPESIVVAGGSLALMRPPGTWLIAADARRPARPPARPPARRAYGANLARVGD